MEDLNRYIDHTLLKPQSRAKDFEKLCLEAIEEGFYSVCVPGSRVSLVKTLVQGSPVKVCAVVGFPLGNSSTESKSVEAATCVEEGADEIDMVINLGFLKDQDWDAVEEDIRTVKSSIQGRVLKVILETSFLEEKEIVRACQATVDAGADFVKTSTGFSSAGATVEQISLMRKTVGPNFGVKASGGIRDQKKALEMIQAGATRLGTSSSVEIVRGEKGHQDY